MQVKLTITPSDVFDELSVLERKLNTQQIEMKADFEELSTEVKAVQNWTKELFDALQLIIEEINLKMDDRFKGKDFEDFLKANPELKRK